MRTIGVVGGIASGKSQVSRLFEKLGAQRIDVDRLGHQVLEDPTVQAALCDRWGASVVVDGRTDRSAVGVIVFADESELTFLEQTTHPKIKERIEDILADAQQSHQTAVVMDAAVMMKANWDGVCDHVVYVDAPREVRLRRASERGWTTAQFTAREAAQVSLAEKRKRADLFVDNTGTLEETFHQVKQIWSELFGSTP